MHTEKVRVQIIFFLTNWVIFSIIKILIFTIIIKLILSIIFEIILPIIKNLIIKVMDLVMVGVRLFYIIKLESKNYYWAPPLKKKECQIASNHIFYFLNFDGKIPPLRSVGHSRRFARSLVLPRALPLPRCPARTPRPQQHQRCVAV